MSDNLPDFSLACAPLADYATVSIQGPDASVFAQAQFANDVVALAPGHWQWNAWLTAKGRLIAVFALLKRAEDHLVLLLPDLPAAAFRESLQRFVFRRKVVIDAEPGWQVGGAFAEPTQARGNVLHDAADGIELDWSGAGGPRVVHLTGPQAGATAASAVPADLDGFARRWREADLRHGLPRLPDAPREQWTPQQLSLERLNAFSVRKGCYPGQEIVARTHFLGKAKRETILLEVDAPVEAGAQVLQSDTVVGSVACGSGDGALALAVVSLGLDPDAPLQLRAAPPEGPASMSAGPSAAPMAARRRALADGLAR